jgi:hypothetical protein
MKKECQVCFEYHSTSLFPKITAKCKHKSNICKLCVKKHISTKLNSQFDVEINCPFDKCNQRMQHADIEKICKRLFKRFDTLMLNQTLSKLPEFRWCKNPGCNSGQIHLEGGNNSLRIIIIIICYYYFFKKKKKKLKLILILSR